MDPKIRKELKEILSLLAQLTIQYPAGNTNRLINKRIDRINTILYPNKEGKYVNI